MRASISSTDWPLFSAVGGTIRPSFTPNSSRDGYARASALRRMFLYSNDEAPKSSSQSMELMNACSSAASIPVANAPPISPPMLVPAATSIGMRCSCSHRITPTCAMPRALPPPNATPTLGGCAVLTAADGAGPPRAGDGVVVARCKGAAQEEHNMAPRRVIRIARSGAMAVP